MYNKKVNIFTENFEEKNLTKNPLKRVFYIFYTENLKCEYYYFIVKMSFSKFFIFHKINTIYSIKKKIIIMSVCYECNID